MSLRIGQLWPKRKLDERMIDSGWMDRNWMDGWIYKGNRYIDDRQTDRLILIFNQPLTANACGKAVPQTWSSIVTSVTYSENLKL